MIFKTAIHNLKINIYIYLNYLYREPYREVCQSPWKENQGMS